ncbi:LOW QUALITY PROTEIN: hypothetical protein SETIT_9G094200v2 [Setaria italica]|uniref:Uncharacterized protein n=1 Tax=Setaria italica TaxID=4555 RepID=A0A368SEY3_SETIT|nr:LOW QUALITY PROTEIN: hypothetical protein SETIT_9G094200v2 [Setaria italica]
MAERWAVERCGGRAAKRRALERGGGRVAKRRQRQTLPYPRRLAERLQYPQDLSSDGFGGSDETPGWKMAAHFSGGWELACTGDQRLPPATFRVEAQRGLPTYFAAAFDSKILAMHPIAPAAALSSVLEGHFPVFDVRMRSCLFAPRMETTGADPIYIPAGGRLFALADGTFDRLDPLDPPPVQFYRPAYGEEARAWSWLELPDPPFERRHVAAYAVHPDGHTIFVSITKGASAATTFAFDTAEHEHEWKRHGEWALPFAGRAHYDRELDAWVGLSGDSDSIGHLSSCDVVPADPDAGGDSRCPARKLSKEKLFGDVPTERHVGATLVYTGGRSEYCLVQCVSIEDDGEQSDYEEDDSDDERNGGDLEGEDYCVCHDHLLYDYDEEEDGSADETKDCDLREHEQDVTSGIRRYLLRLTTFALKYDRNGDLTTGSGCRVRYYRVPKESTVALLSNPVAFWM